MPSNKITPAEWEALHGAQHDAKHADGAIPESAPFPPSSALNVRIVSDEERELWKAAYCSALTGTAIHGSRNYAKITEDAAVFADLAVEDFRKKFGQA